MKSILLGLSLIECVIAAKLQKESDGNLIRDYLMIIGTSLSYYSSIGLITRRISRKLTDSIVSFILFS